MNLYIYILAMAVTTYLIRMLPLTVFKKPIKSRFIRSFLHYVPVACLTAMTFPAILFAGDHMLSGMIATLVGIFLAFKNKSLIVVALATSATVFVAEQLLKFL